MGEYRIVLTGRPRTEATFTPFELSYTAVVAIGSAAASQTESAAPTASPGNALEAPTFPEPNQSSRSWAQLVAMGAAVLGVGWAIAVAASRLRHQKANKSQGGD